jgi:Amt family ammonium transporter
MLPHDLTIAVVGGLILWFGWYGFNPGSTLSAMDFAGIGASQPTPRSQPAPVGSSRSSSATAGARLGPGFITNGFLAGLVAITCPCYWVSPFGSIMLGGIAGGIVILGTELLEYLRIDDPVGAWPVHGLCGIWGTLSLGLFACGMYHPVGSSPMGVPVPDATNPALAGLFYGGGFTLLKAQCIGSAIVCSSTFVAANVVFAALHAMGLLRISKEGEVQGMDLHEHGISAYPEYVIAPSAAPAGLPAEAINAHVAALTGSRASSSPSATVAPSVL